MKSDKLKTNKKVTGQIEGKMSVKLNFACDFADLSEDLTMQT